MSERRCPECNELNSGPGSRCTTCGGKLSEPGRRPVHPALRWVMFALYGPAIVLVVLAHPGLALTAIAGVLMLASVDLDP